jgi:hypothetical protein
MGFNDDAFIVTGEELTEDLIGDFEKAMQEYKAKLLLSYGCTHDNKVFQKTKFPRTLLDGQRDPDAVNAQHEMSETIGRAMSDTLTNHNRVFINTLKNTLGEVMQGRPFVPIGPSYDNQITETTSVQIASGGDQPESS